MGIKFCHGLCLCLIFCKGCQESATHGTFGSAVSTYSAEEIIDINKEREEKDKHFYSIPSDDRLNSTDPKIRNREIQIRRRMLIPLKTTYEEVIQIMGKPDEEAINTDEIILFYHPARIYKSGILFSTVVFINAKSKIYIYSDD